jgi:hypothetical protein
MEITLDDGTVETVLVDDADYLDAIFLVMYASGHTDPTNHKSVERLKVAINEYAEIGLMLDEILGVWR